ncbi:MAG: hypothetical protein ABEJ78_01630 [Haloferacaceae archaeon]
MTPSESTPLQHQLKEYLMDKIAANNGSTFVKSRHIADDFDVSAKRIGAAMAALEDDSSIPLLMERRGGNSNGTTWYIKNSSAIESNS